MEYHDTLDNDFSSSFGFSAEAKEHLLETAGWGKFIAIVGFIMIGLLVVLALFIGAIFSFLAESVPGYSQIPMGSTSILTGIYLVFAAIYFFPTFYLFRFSVKAQNAIRLSDTESLTVAMKNLKSSFKFVGILTIILLGFYALAFFGGLAGGMLSSL